MVVMVLLAVVVTSLADVVATALQWRNEAEGFSRTTNDTAQVAQCRWHSAGTHDQHALAGSTKW